MTAPVVLGPARPPRRSLRLNPSTLPQLPHEEKFIRSIAPLVTSYYGASLEDVPSSPTICRANSPYNHHAGSTGSSTGGSLQGQADAESPSGLSQGAMEFPTPGMSVSHLQHASSTSGLHFNSMQSFREQEQLFRSPHRPISRWPYTEPSSPAEDLNAGIYRDKHRRSSLKTCELEEAGLDFPGCYVLVPTTEGPTTSEATVIEGPEPGLISTKKNLRRPMVESERQAIKLNRKYGVCLRCKMFKERVQYLGSAIFDRFLRNLVPRRSSMRSLPFFETLEEHLRYCTSCRQVSFFERFVVNSYPYNHLPISIN